MSHRDPMNLKLVLMDLGNMLVSQHGFRPATLSSCSRPVSERSTLAIKQFTEFVNSTPEAVALLGLMGFKWETISEEQRYRQLASIPEGEMTPEQQHQFEYLSAFVDRGC